MFNEALKADLARAIEARGLKAILVSAWSNQHFIFSCFNNPEPLDFIPPGEEFEDVPDQSRIVPFDVIYARVKQACAAHLLLLSHIRSLTEAPIVLPSAPPPIDDVLAIPGGTSSSYFDDKVRELGVAPASLRRKFWRLCEAIFREACEQQGITFIAAPPETFDEHGFRRREYWSADWLHANAEYGELVLCQIDNLLSQIKESDNGRSSL